VSAFTIDMNLRALVVLLAMYCPRHDPVSLNVLMVHDVTTVSCVLCCAEGVLPIYGILHGTLSH
jgi:hypothetical protein